jgi:SAM-dependent methyltransferase
MISSIKLWLRNRSFNPGKIGFFINPFSLLRQSLYREIKKVSDTITGTTLDVGCGEKPYRKLFPAHTYIGAEIPSTSAPRRQAADILYDGLNLPFRSAAFDSIVCIEVLEHVFEPDAFMSEIYRVLKPEGTLLITVPFIWTEHELPMDYGRYTAFGLMHLASKNGFIGGYSAKLLPGFPGLCQMLASYIFDVARRRGRWISGLSVPIVIAPILIVGLFFSLSKSLGDTLYLGNLVLFKKGAAAGRD